MEKLAKRASRPMHLTTAEMEGYGPPGRKGRPPKDPLLKLSLPASAGKGGALINRFINPPASPSVIVIGRVIYEPMLAP